MLIEMDDYKIGSIGYEYKNGRYYHTKTGKKFWCCMMDRCQVEVIEGCGFCKRFQGWLKECEKE